MKISQRIFVLIAMMGVILSGLLMCPEMALAADSKCGEGQVETNLFGCVKTGEDGEGVFTVLNIILTVMTYGVGILATVGIVISAIQYLTARDNESQMAAAKKRIFELVIGLAVWVIAYAALKWLLPGFK